MHGSSETPETHLLSESAVTTAEKRRLERTRTDQLLYVELGTGNGGILLNVSEEGCGFLAIAPIWDEKPHFKFAIGGGRHIQGDGKVVWVDDSKKLGGLRFVNPSAAFREQMRAWLAEPKVAETAPAEPEQAAQADILAPMDESVDSPAKQRRKELRDAARAELEAREAAEKAAAELGSAAQPEGLTASEAALDAVTPQAHGEETAWVPAFIHRVSPRVAAVALGAILMILAVAFHEQAGKALMRLGTSLAGGPAETPRGDGGKKENAAIAGAAQLSAAVVPPAPTAVSQVVKTAAVEAEAEPAKGAPEEVSRSTKKETKEKEATSNESKSQDKKELAAASGPIVPAPAPAAKQAPREKKGSHATAEQVQALWAEVEGGDVGAEIALGELYAKGNGVTKSCGQARMLLNSAAKKGSEEARQKLDQLAEDGCP